ncbi:putative Monocarboxylate transporter 2 [Hypsibius exemplaris]|uniref:Monocarboxylate transporter 2 n=1 Tax=Hypsibius exemplaris TaxID=2072580 RepID=A0A1W0WWN2_HYPEX|nr:putative Monocarboxylate transporter 2 [Hypsibius exemplaris]
MEKDGTSNGKAGPEMDSLLSDPRRRDIAPVIVVDTEGQKVAFVQEGDVRKTENAAPDGGFGWIIVFGVFMIHIIIDGITYSFGILLPDLLDKFEGSKGETSWIISVLIGTTYGCGPLPSLLASKFGRRPVALAGGVIACLGAFLSSYSTQIWQLIMLYGFLTGLGCGLMYLPAVVTVNYWFEKNRARAVGIAVCGSGMGMMVFPPLTRYLLDEYSVSGCLIIFAGVLLNCCVFCALLRPTPAECWAGKKTHLVTNLHSGEVQELKELLPNDKVVIVDESRPAGGLRGKVRGARVWIVKQVDMDLMRQWRFWLYCLAAAFGGISSYIPHSFLPHRAETEAGIDKELAAYLISIMGFANLAGRLMSSLISDQRWLNRMIVYCCCCFVAGLSTTFSIFATHYYTFAIYAAVYGFSGGFIIALQSVVLTDIVGLEKLTAAFGLLLLLEGACVFVGPPMAGSLTDYFDGDYTWAFVVTGILMSLAGVSLLVVPVVNFVVAKKSKALKVMVVT